MINSQIATARAMPSHSFLWYGLETWNPAELYFTTHKTKPRPWNFWAKAAFARWAAIAKADVYHSIFHATPSTSRAMRQILRRKPVIQTVQTLHSSMQDLKAALFGDHLIAVSRRLERAIRDVSSKPVTTIHPAVDPNRFTMRTPDIRRKLGIPESVPLVLYPGGWGRGLGVLDAIKCFDELAAGSNAHLVIANRHRPTDDSGLIAAAKEYQQSNQARVSLLASVPDFTSLLMDSSVVLFPATDLRDQKLDLPLVLLESMHLGIPLAVYDVEPISELNPQTLGVTAAVGDVGSLARGVARLLDEPEFRSWARVNAQLRARSAFHPSVLAVKLSRAYEALLNS